MSSIFERKSRFRISLLLNISLPVVARGIDSALILLQMLHDYHFLADKISLASKEIHSQENTITYSLSAGTNYTSNIIIADMNNNISQHFYICQDVKRS